MRLSVCIPARDAEAYLEQALASALAQDVDGMEVVVVDDGSTDATSAILASAADPRLRRRRLARPHGVAAARNVCLALARGEYVAWLDADDVLLPGALAAQLAVLDAHPEVSLVHGAHETFDADGRRLRTFRAPFAHDAIEPSGRAFRELLCSNEIVTSTAMARRCVRFAPEVGASSSDWDAWLRLALQGAVAYTARPLARYRQHAATISHATVPAGERLRCDARVAARALRAAARRPGDRERRGLAAAALAVKALLHAGDAHTRGDRGAAACAVTLARRLVPELPAGELLAATRRGDDLACEQLTKGSLGRLAERLAGTRFGAHVRDLARRDETWSAALSHAARSVAERTPADAVIAAIAKWDPALLAGSGRAGCNLPDRTLLPGGYPRDGAEAVVHLEALRRERGVTHVVVPEVSGWWLEAYPELAARLGRPQFDDGRCAIFALEPA